MEEVSPVPASAPESAGDTLRLARERQGLSLAEVASRTRVPLRHLEAIEAGNYNGLPSHTYATGFAKAYARAVGVDEVALTRRVRGELAQTPRAPEYQPYEAPDPARVPSRGLAIVTLGIALAVIVLAGLWYSGTFNRTGAPVVATPTVVAAAPTPASIAAPSPAVPTGGQVTLQTTDRVWMKVHDGDKTLYIGTMNPGERFDVPATAENPLVDIGRPDKLRVTLNGSSLPPLAASARPVTNLRVGAAAVAARLQGGVAPVANATPSSDASRSPPAAPTADAARANLDAAANPPAGNTQ